MNVQPSQQGQPAATQVPKPTISFSGSAAPFYHPTRSQNRTLFPTLLVQVVAMVAHPTTIRRDP